MHARVSVALATCVAEGGEIVMYARELGTYHGAQP